MFILCPYRVSGSPWFVLLHVHTERRSIAAAVFARISGHIESVSIFLVSLDVPWCKLCTIILLTYHLFYVGSTFAMASLHLYTRTGPPPYPNPLSLPTTPLQQKGLAALFIFPALSIIIVSMRMYSRVTSRTVGLGEFLSWSVQSIPKAYLG